MSDVDDATIDKSANEDWTPRPPQNWDVVIDHFPLTQEEAEAMSAMLIANDRYMNAEAIELEPGKWTVNASLRDDWKELTDHPRKDAPVKAGERFIITREAKVNLQIRFVEDVPLSSSDNVSVQQGLRLVAREDQKETPTFYLVPEDYDEMETTFVGEASLVAPNYRGYAIQFLVDDIDDLLEPVTADTSSA